MRLPAPAASSHSSVCGLAFSILSLSPRRWWCTVPKRQQSLSRWAASERSWGAEEACWGGVRAADPILLLTESPGGGALTESLHLNFKTCLYLASQVALEITSSFWLSFWGTLLLWCFCTGHSEHRCLFVRKKFKDVPIWAALYLQT